MVDDVWDTWPHITHLFDVAQRWYSYIKPGTWPDCDMIPLGRISLRGERGADRMTRLTKDEQYTLMTLFTIFRSPLMFGGDLPSNDAFTLSLLTNKEVLKMHRESTDVRQLYQKDKKVAITSRNPKTGEVYVALFNLSEDKIASKVSVNLADMSIKGKCTITDMWTGKIIGDFSGELSRPLVGHACGLYKIKGR
jgi:alpha-galactosidase